MKRSMLAAVLGFFAGAAALGGVWATNVDTAEVRIAAQRHQDGRTEFALQRTGNEGAWLERYLPNERIMPSDAESGRWYVSTPVVLTTCAAEVDEEPDDLAGDSDGQAK